MADDSWHQVGNEREYWGVNVKGKDITFFYDQKLKIKAYLEGDQQAPLDPCTLVLEVENEGDDVAFLPKSALKYGQPNSKNFSELDNAYNGYGTLELQPQEKATRRYPFTVPFQGGHQHHRCPRCRCTALRPARPSGECGSKFFTFHYSLFT